MGNYVYGNNYEHSHDNHYENTAIPAIDSYNWNYEAEKSYWFELSGRKDKLQQLVDDGLQNIHLKNNSTASLVADESARKTAQVKTEQNTEFPSSETLAFDNVDEKLQQMLQ